MYAYLDSSAKLCSSCPSVLLGDWLVRTGICPSYFREDLKEEKEEKLFERCV